MLVRLNPDLLMECISLVTNALQKQQGNLVLATTLKYLRIKTKFNGF